MTREYEPLLEASIEIASPAADVWALISDVRRMPAWSPQVLSTRLRDDRDALAVGTEFTNLNHEGDDLQWTTHARIVRLAPERELAFQIEENRVIWAFQLTPIDASRTHLSQRRETPTASRRHRSTSPTVTSAGRRSSRRPCGQACDKPFSASRSRSNSEPEAISI